LHGAFIQPEPAAPGHRPEARTLHELIPCNTGRHGQSPRREPICGPSLVVLRLARRLTGPTVGILVRIAPLFHYCTANVQTRKSRGIKRFSNGASGGANSLQVLACMVMLGVTHVDIRFGRRLPPCDNFLRRSSFFSYDLPSYRSEVPAPPFILLLRYG
jgi:hypothetical protein